MIAGVNPLHASRAAEQARAPVINAPANQDAVRYMGPERRIHRVFVTRNTEYHVRGGVCVAVRDRREGAWIADHEALGKPIAGGIHFPNGAGFLPYRGEPAVGDGIHFHGKGRDVVTSPLERIERPTRDVVTRYPH
jgi:hypothetical protein